MESRVCAYCGKEFPESRGWPHVEGDSNKGVIKIEHFCSEEHRTHFLNASIS
jgi:ribosomal protein L24E